MRVNLVVNSADAEGPAFQFGPFRLIPARQLLLRGDTRVRLGSRALDILTALVERPGQLVTKQELIVRTWPDTVVEESNLKVHIAALRKALGEEAPDEQYFVTVTGRGYRFVAPVQSEATSLRTVTAQESRPGPSHNVPVTFVRPIGRSAEIETLRNQLGQTRFVTITGPGGVGKTTVALSLARALADDGQCDVWFADLAALSEESLVPGAVAAAVGLTVHSSDVTSALASYFSFRDRQQVVVLDSCEHVVEAAAAMVESIVSASPEVRVLATSREPLRATGEHVYRLEPLASPIASASLKASEALQYPAIQLFMERSAASRGDFDLSDENAPVVAEICRRLDGIALAIELAATRLDAFGIRELLNLLDNRLVSFGQGRRTAPERQKTLAATLDWSYQLLPDIERTLLRRLGIFAGVFQLDSARAVAACDDIKPSTVIDGLASLVAKSLISADVGVAPARYRLLDTTRDYARRKLADTGELNAIARQHAGHFHDIFVQAEQQWGTSQDAGGRSKHLRAIDDVRAALIWAFSVDGNTALGVALTVSTIPAFFQLFALDECRSRIELALARMDPCSPLGEIQGMKLHAALAESMMYTRGMVPAVEHEWTTALTLAEKLEDRDYQIRALWGLAVVRIYAGEHGAACRMLERFRLVAGSAGDAAAITDADRLAAFSLHYMGQHAVARGYFEAMLDQRLVANRKRQPSRFHVDSRVAIRSGLSHVLWVQGYPDRALANAKLASEEAEATGHVLTLGYMLVLTAVPLALYTGDLAMAEMASKALDEHLVTHGIVIWKSMARSLQGALLIQRNDEAGLRLLKSALHMLRQENIGMRYPMYVGVFAQGLLNFGRAPEALAAIEDALAWSDAHEEHWCTPELLRVKGEILGSGRETQSAEQAHARSEVLYLQAIDLARQQGALSWELRAAMSLARSRHRIGDTERAITVLASVYERFSEGFETADLKAARALLEGFGEVSMPQSGVASSKNNESETER